MGPKDQNQIEEREDILVYATPPLEEPLEVTGPVSAVLWVTSDASATDFTAKLVDVHPDGSAYNLTDGIARVKGLNVERTRVEIDLWATSNVFLQCHSIRVEITSSNFSRYDVNTNTGLTTMDSSEVKEAVQVVKHGQIYPSHILLPIILHEDKG